MTDQVTLWGAGTTRTLRPIWVAEEIGVPYDLEPIGPRTGETQTAEFSELNRKQKVPLLVSGDFRLSESLAICRYLLEVHPSQAMYVPEGIEERAREEEWCSHIYGEIDETSLYVMRRHGDLGHIYGEAPDVVEASRRYAARHLQVAGELLDGRQSVMEGGFGLADVLLQSCLDWAVAYEVEFPAELEAYRQGIAQRDGYRRAMTLNYGEEWKTWLK